MACTISDSLFREALLTRSLFPTSHFSCNSCDDVYNFLSCRYNIYPQAISADNHLVLNILKCCYMVFCRRHHPTLPNAPLYVGDSQALNKRDHFKYLGVNFSTDLAWSYHINTICKKTRKLIGLLCRNFYQFSNPSTLLKLYKSVILPHMDYACMVWDPHLAKDVKLMYRSLL